MKKNNLKSFFSFTIILLVSIYSLFASGGQIEQLKIHFRSCEYQKTIELADVILKNPDLNRRDKTEIYIIKGISEYSSNKFLDAQITFAELLLYDKNITLSSKKISPKIVELFNEIKHNTVTILVNE